MGFNINEEITIKLNYKDIALITVAMSYYEREFWSKSCNEEVLNRAKNLIHRIGEELYNCPQDEPNGH
jgi:hypothetical protein